MSTLKVCLLFRGGLMGVGINAIMSVQALELDTV